MTHAIGMDKARGWRTKSVCSDLSVYSEEPSTPLASRMFNREKELPARPDGDEEGEGEGSSSSAGEEGVWVYLRGRASAVDLDFLRLHPHAAPPPSPLSPFTAMHSRPRAPTPSASTSPVPDSPWSPAAAAAADPHFPPSPPSRASDALFLAAPDSPAFSPAQPHFHSPLLARPDDGDEDGDDDDDDDLLPYSDPSLPHSFARPPKPAALPDPAHFPDPYPFRPPHQYLSSTPPALSSGGSESASTRSSAYTSAHSSTGSALASGDYGNHVHVASSHDDPVGVGITSDDVVHLMRQDPHDPHAPSHPSHPSHSRVPIDQTRWSHSYSASIRSRTSLVRSNSITAHENPAPALKPKPSYDLSWQAVDERDEVDLTSGDETEDTDLDPDDFDDDDDVDHEEERTSAVVMAEEGRGQIVRGDGVSTVHLHVQPGTTHLLVGSSSTPSAIPSFLTTTLPQINLTLVALDISANFLGALPPALESCIHLEELNISSNPLRALPLFVANLVSLRVLIADSTGVTTLPTPLSALEKLHTLSIRRNKFYSLPSWLCLLTSLEALLVDGNPFQGPWKALVDPLLPKEPPPTPVYTPSTPMLALHSATTQDSESYIDTDLEDSPESPLPDHDGRPTEDEDTITPERAPFLGRATSYAAPEAGGQPAHGVVRTRTTPNRAYYDKSRRSGHSRADPSAQSGRKVPDSGYFGEPEIRRMKSASELRRDAMPVPSSSASQPSTAASTPHRPGLAHYPTSMSASNLLEQAALLPEPSPLPMRFASIGVTAGTRTSPARPALDRSLWERLSSAEPSEDGPSTSSRLSRKSFARDQAMSPSSVGSQSPPDRDSSRPRSGSRRKDDRDKDKEKHGRWGFLKKMSMGKMRSDSPGNSRPSTAQGRPSYQTQPLVNIVPVGEHRSSSVPLLSRGPSAADLEMRISATGNLDVNPPLAAPEISVSPTTLEESEPTTPAGAAPSPSPSPSMLSTNLSVTSSATRGARRRSFLPIDGPPSLSVPLPSTFLPGLTATDGTDDGDDRKPNSPTFHSTPSPGSLHVDTMEQLQRREEERAREAYTRALRSVMAYLRDMNDLSLSQTNTSSIYGGSTPPSDGAGSGARSRRPTMIDSARVVSDGSFTSGSRSNSSDQLRSMESIARLRSLSSSQTASVATTDSSGSNGGEERKFKDDSGKRAMIVREIVTTERTYVKGLQELVDIYIKPASAPVNLLGGVGSNKETVVPAPERKLVFSGLESLFSFHKESFLPALERAAAPLLKPAEASPPEQNAQLSQDVAKSIANSFVSHAAFMRMYSTYINNFENSVQRIKYWVSERSTTAHPSGGPASSSSTAQMVGLGLAISSITSPGLSPDAPMNGPAPLSSGQRKRIKSYLKRCRLNPRHSQLNLEGYLLLPIQRIPRYRLLLEELARCTPPTAYDYIDPLDKALTEISSLATNMNEGKRESESRRKLVQWQSRIRGKFPSPLVQPHRRLIMDGPLLLTRVVRKATIAFEVINAQGDASTVQVECLSPEQTPRSLIGILCNDLLVLCRDPSEGKDPHSPVDLWAVLRMQTLPQPASIVHGNVLRLVDNKAILYFEATSTSDALTWFRAINLHIPSSKA